MDNEALKQAEQLKIAELRQHVQNRYHDQQAGKANRFQSVQPNRPHAGQLSIGFQKQSEAKQPIKLESKLNPE